MRIIYVNQTFYFKYRRYNDKTEGPNPEILLDPYYFDLQIYHVHYARNADSTTQEINSTNIPYEYWNINSTKYESFLSKSIKNLTYLCPKFQDYFIRSNYNSDNFDTIEIILNKWIRSTWKYDSEIAAVFSTHYLDVGIISTYFDFNNYDNPVRYLIIWIEY